jgi:hypothetical protein|tara:strand:+ start:284 stop:817 length:534 start_codon:yes stop_codon:yes gene_type:complete
MIKYRACDVVVMRVSGECMIWGCKDQPFSACPFCTVKYCQRHGTVSKRDAWPKSKYPSSTPYPYWPCSICYRNLRNHAEFDGLSESEFVQDAIKTFSSISQVELEQGLGKVPRPKGLAKSSSLPSYSNPTTVREPKVSSSNSTGIIKKLGAIIIAPFMVFGFLAFLFNGKYDTKGPP